MIVAAALMTAQTAFADEAAPAAPASAPVQPLAPGQAAGIQVAQSRGDLNKIAIVAGVGLAAVAVFLIVGTHYHVPGQNQSSTGTK